MTQQIDRASYDSMVRMREHLNLPFDPAAYSVVETLVVTTPDQQPQAPGNLTDVPTAPAAPPPATTALGHGRVAPPGAGAHPAPAASLTDAAAASRERMRQHLDRRDYQ